MKRIFVIVGISIGVLVLLLVGGGGALWWLYRRRDKRRKLKATLDIDPDLAPTPYMSDGPTGQVLSINAFLDQLQHPYSPKMYNNGMATMTMAEATRSSTHFDPYYHLMETRTGPPSTSDQPTSSGSSSSNAGNMANFHLAPLRRSKAMEAARMSDSTLTLNLAASDSSSTLLLERSQSAQPSDGLSPEAPWFTRSTSMVQTASEREMVYQHRDGGVVRELPPPYLNRSPVDGTDS